MYAHVRVFVFYIFIVISLCAARKGYLMTANARRLVVNVITRTYDVTVAVDVNRGTIVDALHKKPIFVLNKRIYLIKCNQLSCIHHSKIKHFE